MASALIETHDRVFRRTARRYSICADDAEDAYQRALEILLTKAPPIEGDSLVRWMQTVTKREALAVRRLRERLLGTPRIPGVEDIDERDPLDSIASDRPEPEDRAGSRERVTRSREALRALKPQELRALTLKAEGYSYAEIGEITGWTYTKVAFPLSFGIAAPPCRPPPTPKPDSPGHGAPSLFNRAARDGLATTEYRDVGIRIG